MRRAACPRWQHHIVNPLAVLRQQAGDDTCAWVGLEVRVGLTRVCTQPRRPCTVRSQRYVLARCGLAAHAHLANAEVEVIGVGEKGGLVVHLRYELLDVGGVVELDEVVPCLLYRVEEAVGMVKVPILQNERLRGERLEAQ